MNKENLGFVPISVMTDTPSFCFTDPLLNMLQIFPYLQNISKRFEQILWRQHH